MDQVTFTEFADHWEENAFVCSQIKVGEGRLAEDENILKVSRMIKTDLGIGRLVLTDKRYRQTDPGKIDSQHPIV